MSGTDSLRVLVVDDEEDVRLVLSMQLEAEAGITVVGSAADGGEALERSRELEPDAVVMDLLMPNVNGFEAIERLRRELPGIGVVAYTGVAGDFVRSEMQRLGVELALKTGDVTPLAAALQRSVRQAQQD